MHTKGKWEIRGNTIFVEGTTRSVATVHVVKNYNEKNFAPVFDVEADANARLISKAPNMQEAIKTVLGMLSEGAPNIEYIKNILHKSVQDDSEYNGLTF